MKTRSTHQVPAREALPKEIIPNRLPDFEVRGYGTLYLLRLRSDAAQRWIDEHLCPECTMFGDAVVVESRFILPIVNEIMGDGLEVLFGA